MGRTTITPKIICYHCEQVILIHPKWKGFLDIYVGIVALNGWKNYAKSGFPTTWFKHKVIWHDKCFEKCSKRCDCC